MINIDNGALGDDVGLPYVAVYDMWIQLVSRGAYLYLSWWITLVAVSVLLLPWSKAELRRTRQPAMV